MLPDSKSWQAVNNGDGTFVVTDGKTEIYELTNENDANKLVLELERYEEELYRAWEESMGDDL